MESKEFKEHFVEKAKEWVETNYIETNQDFFPIGTHRQRLVLSTLCAELRAGAHVVDLGCGGGNVGVALAQQGFEVTCLDQSAPMLEMAKNLAKEKHVEDKVEFQTYHIEEKSAIKKADALVSMGVIGYLDQPEVLFEIARETVKPGGLFIVSSRNMLFNLYSPSFRTFETLSNPTRAAAMAAEVESLIKASNFQGESIQLPALTLNLKSLKNPLEKASTDIEAYQYLPSDLVKFGKKHGFNSMQSYGVHPHLVSPLFARMMEEKDKTNLDSSLVKLEADPLSLLWSSVIVMVFRKA